MHPESSVRASAEAIFGSASRGDVDTMSDRDILILDDDVSVLRKRAQVLQSQGWSVAAYTYSKLEALAQRGALFVQHLKLESTVLRDRTGRLAQLLENFRPLAEYRSEIRDNDRLAHLAGTAVEGARGMLLAADILYVTVRNYGVLSLAERGIHTYAYSTILEALEAERMIPLGGAKALLGLRFLKCLYRAGEGKGGGRARQAVDFALAALPTIHFPKKLRVVEPRVILRGPAPQRLSPSYLHLRDLERRLVALETLAPDSVSGSDFAQLARWIANPRAYAALSSRIAPRLREALCTRIDLYRPKKGTAA